MNNDPVKLSLGALAILLALTVGSPAEAQETTSTSSAAATAEPAPAETEAPAAETEAPAAETEAPAAETEAPAAETEAPATETEAPPAASAAKESTPPAAGSTAPSSGSGESDEDEDEGEDNAAAALGAANPVVASNTGKPWQVMARAGFSMGSSALTANSADDFSYNVGLTALYRLAPLLEGRLDAFGRTSFSQQLSDGVGFGDGFGATTPQAFIWGDTRLGLLGRGLYKWKDVGLVFGANTSIDLPTSPISQENRLFRWNVGVNAVDMIPKVGPGNLLVSAFVSFRKDASYVNPTISQFSDLGSQVAVCTRANADEQENCFTSRAGVNWGLSYGASMRYFLGKFSLGIGASLSNLFFYDISDSELPGQTRSGVPGSGVGSSPFATEGGNVALFMSTSIGATWVFNRYFNVSASLASFQVPFRYQDGDPFRLVWPFFDSSERSTTSMGLSAALMY